MRNDEWQPAELTVRDLKKSYGRVEVLRGITARILPGETTAFIGPNGAGKTTLFHILTGVTAPDSGVVSLNGIDVSGESSWRIARRGVGWLFQDIRAFRSLTVRENVRLALLEPRQRSALWSVHELLRRTTATSQSEKVSEWLAFVGLDAGPDTLAEQLSYGQQKLLAIARLLATQSPLLLLDEPTSGLAPAKVEKMIELLRKLKVELGVTIAVIEHDMRVVAEVADWVNFVHEGEIAAVGRCDHVLGDAAVRELYVGT